MNKAGFNSTSTNSYTIGDGLSSNKYIYVNTASSNKPAIRYNITQEYLEQSNDGYSWYKMIDESNIVPIYVSYTTNLVNTYERANTIIRNPANLTQYSIYNCIRRTDGYTHISICEFGVYYNNAYKFIGQTNSLTAEQCALFLETDDAYSGVRYDLDGYTGLLTFRYKASQVGVSCKSVIVPVSSQSSTIQYSNPTRSADWWNGKTCTEWELTKVKLLESQRLGAGRPQVCTYANNSGVTPVTSAYIGGVLSNNGLIYLIPASQTSQASLHYINTNTGNVVAYAHGATFASTYSGGVLSPDGKIYMIPFGQSNQSNWHYIDTNTGSIVAYAHGVTCVANAYQAGVLAPNGRIYMIPAAQANQLNWHYIDTNTRTVSAYAHGATAVEYAYVGGVLAPNGRIYMIPGNQANQANWHYIDTNTGNVVAYAHGVTAVSSAYIGGVLTQDGRIYLIPYAQANQTNWHYIDTNTGNVVSYIHGSNAVLNAYRCGVLSSDGKIYMIPYAQADQTNWHYIDTNTGNVVSYIHGISSLSNAYFGGNLINNKIYMVPNNQATQNNWHYIETNSEKPLSNNICTNPMFNKF